MSSETSVLVTGGAGYIGSHVVRGLRDRGHRVTVVDNLYSGHRWAVSDAELIVAELGDRRQMEAVFEARNFDAVMHFAAHIWVGESVTNPAKYYFNNVSNAARLFDLAAQYNVPNVVFSSTAAVYGEPEVQPIPEHAALAPINPYGASKMMAERILHDIAAATGLRYVALRYFNVAGAHASGEIGEATPNNSHLVKIACETAFGLRPKLAIHGTDYPTEDGTCVRDYVHIDDLASAHIDALGYLLAGNPSDVFNCGYGHGYSVREVLATARRVTGVDFTIEEGPKRPGDPPVLVADSKKIQRILGWQPSCDDLELILSSAWAWEKKLQSMNKAA
ncbi:MAG: UDP-glucose 4-epimerase GalE [Geminicoccaceae bacterium]